MARRQSTVPILPWLRWPREGLLTLQQARLGLVTQLDSLLAHAAEKSSFPSVLLDGQTIVVDDYLEVRPASSDAMARAIADGRFSIGPWYIPPHGLLVSAEAMVRNLMIGAAKTSELRNLRSPVFLPDMSGHIGQLPQVLRGFGIDAVIAPVTQHAGAPVSWWTGIDGTSVLLTRAFQGARPGHGAIARPHIGLESPAPSRTAAQVNPVLMLKLDQPEAVLSASEILRELRPLLGKARGVPVTLDTIQEHMGDLPEELPVDVGEVCDPSAAAGAFSARIWVKQANHRMEKLLERWAEPFCAWGSLIESRRDNHTSPAWRLRQPNALIHYAWRQLLQNQSASVLTGAYIDAAEMSVRLRFADVQQIGEELTRQSLAFLAAQIDTEGLADEDDIPVIVFNGAPHRASELVSFDLDLPPTHIPFEIVGPGGQPQHFDVEIAEADIAHGLAHATIQMAAGGVPPIGYSTYLIRAAETAMPEVVLDAGETIENEALSLTLDANTGTFNLFDKRTGRSFSGLNHVVDGGDCGDVLSYCAPERDTLIDIATNTPLHIERHVSPVEQSLQTFQIYRLPQSLTAARDARLPFTAQFVPISIWTAIYLRRGTPRVDVVVTVTNAALDHRLRVHFPTGIHSSEATYDEHFAVTPRAILPESSDKQDGRCSHVYPVHDFVTVKGASTGLTVATRGLPELELIPTDSGIELALTLLRSVDWLVRPGSAGGSHDAEPGIRAPNAQCLDEYTFAYSLIPHGDDPVPAWELARAYQSPLKAFVAARHPGGLSPQASLVESLNPSFIVTAVMETSESDAGSLLIRGYSISDTEQQVILRLGGGQRIAEKVRLDETSTGEQHALDADGLLVFSARPGEIVTFRLR